MKAAVFHSGTDVRVENVPDLRPGPGEVLCRVGAAGICGSDLHGYRAAKEGRPWAGRYPRVAPGHELAGTVVALGEGVTALCEGDRVGIEPLCGCGQCEWCRTGQYHLCPQLEHIGGARSGGFAEFAVAPVDKCFRLPAHVAFDEASTLDCAAVGLHAIHRVPITPQDTVVVFGAGPIGLYTAACARLAGAALVIVVGGRRERPLALAREHYGAHETLRASAGDPVQAILELTGGRGAEVVFETVGGHANTLDQCLASTRRGGTVGVVGAFHEPQTFTPALGMRKELSLVWVWSYAMWGTRAEYAIVLDMLAAGRLRARPMITHHYPLAEIGAAFAAADDKGESDAIKVVVAP